MKRFISLMLIAMLLVGCLSTVAFADGGVRTGTITVTISGEFSSFGGWVSVSSPAKMTGISGITGNAGSGKVGYANNENVSAVSFTVSVEVPANYCGTISAGFSQDEANKVIKNADGTVAGHEAVSVSGGGSTTFAHDWGAEVVTPGADCQTAGTVTKTCTICGAKDTATGPVGDHAWKTEWSKDNHNHWHECAVCGTRKDEDKHTFGAGKDTGKRTDDGYEVWGKTCTVCAKYLEYLVHPDVPPTGDITPYGTYNAVFFIAAMFALCCTTGMIFKRKFTK